MALIETDGLCMEYPQPGTPVTALRDVTVRIERGEFAAVTGESGSGKSTLLALLGGLERPTRGSLRFRELPLGSAPAGRLTEYRRDHVGFVFQDFRLIHHLTVLQNVLLPLLFSGGEAGRRDEALRRLDRVNLGHRLGHRPHALSRGEMQRVAVVRALANAPELLLADEPTANLDRRHGDVVWQMLRELNRSEGLTVVVATHNADLARDASHRILLEDGSVAADEKH